MQVSAGEPLLLSYGKLSNDFLLMDYGFVVAANPHDAVQLRFDVGLLQVGRAGRVGGGRGSPVTTCAVSVWGRETVAVSRTRLGRLVPVQVHSTWHAGPCIALPHAQHQAC